MTKKQDIEILYEDNNLMVINKPAGLSVHSGFNKKDFTLVDWLDKKYPPKGSIQLLNRIDLDTSGIVLAAKNNSFINTFNTKLNKTIKKEYILLTKTPAKTFKEISRPLKGVYTDKTIPKTAVTKISSQERLKGGYSLFRASLVTGRTHQIRRHFKMIGAPIIGDWQYGNIQLNKTFRKKYKLRRQFLHAHKVKIDNFPLVTAPLPKDLQKILDDLKK
jgi:RluA family pseudouridine synthase